MNLTPAAIEEALPYLTAEEQAEIDDLLAGMPSDPASVRAYLFDKQLALADDPHRFITGCCGRRAGKTVTVATMILQTAAEHPNRVVLYLTLTRDTAKGILWPTLKQLNEQFSMGGTANESDLTMTMPNGAVIALRGVDKRKEIEKRRGFGFSLVVIDECQSIPEYVRALVDQVIAPALADVPGRLVMIGTPSLIASGYWHECHHNPNPVWAHYEWTLWDNPFIKNPDRVFGEELARRGVPADDASILREWRGLWIRDVSSAVFTFSPGRNTYAKLPKLSAEGWRYVVSVDIGGGVNRDNDAVTVLAFHLQARPTWLVEEHVSPTQDVTTLALLVKSIVNRLGPERVVAIVADTGGIGAKVALEMSSRHGLGVAAAKKSDKWANIALLNAACNHAEFFAPPESAFATECVKVEKDWDHSTPDRIAIKGHMPDVCDSVLYGYVESFSWTSRVPAEQPKPGSREHYDAEAKRLMEETRQRVEEMKAEREEVAGVGMDIEDGNEWGIE